MKQCISDVLSAESIHNAICEDGYCLSYRVWAPQVAPIATVLLINGMMSHSGWFRDLARELLDRQLHVVGADRRGTGLNDKERGDAPSRLMLISDLRQVIATESLRVPVYLAGWCWGALLAINAALDFGEELSGLILLAPGLFPTRLIKDAVHDEATKNEAKQEPNIAYLHSPIKAEMFSEQPSIRSFILNDDLAQLAFTPRFFEISHEMSLIATSRLGQLCLPMLLLLAAADRAVDHEQTLRAFDRLQGRVNTATLPCSHGMQFEVPQQIAIQIESWLKTQGLPRPG